MSDQVRENIARNIKSENRVKGYQKGTPDWKAEYNMLLPDGATCNDCCNVRRCCALFGQTPYINSGKCQFYPSHFQPIPEPVLPQEVAS